MLDVLAFFMFAITGRVLIYIWQIFPLPPVVSKSKVYVLQALDKLHVCDLCAGFWVYGILALAVDVDLFVSKSVIGYIATGAITSFLTHIFAIGWKSKFEVITV